MQLGLTWPLQGLLKLKNVPYGAPLARKFCWDAHCITLRGRSSLLLVHCASRYTCVRFDMTPADWAQLDFIVLEEIREGLLDAGLEAARVLEDRFGTPYIVGVPYGRQWGRAVLDGLMLKMQPHADDCGAGIVIIGEGVTSLSLAQAIELETGKGTRVLCPTECDPAILREKDLLCRSEEEIEAYVKNAELVIADPLYRPICPGRFLDLPSEAFSGRIYRKQIPDLVRDFETFICEVL